MDELIAFLRAVAEIDADDIHIDMNVHGINSRDGLDLLQGGFLKKIERGADNGSNPPTGVAGGPADMTPRWSAHVYLD
jgi:hypothetical protein